ncbi:MAG: adenylyl-sulfate kinase [Lachnospiraceae bacterium]|nr:adenylyl-sulfate kinase [Lachnospiraceae bacterium]
MQSLLKFITCGSVDDGKSTLIGHMLYDAKLLFADQEKALELDSKVGSTGGQIDYSLLLDGLMAEREQGITIDVAYRYFTTENRSFIVADTPGHEEYTRNMAVGASFADLAIILVDASKGVLVQTKRHTRICSLMGIKHVVYAINKMDLIDYDKNEFDDILRDIKKMTVEYDFESMFAIPVSATVGDNITVVSERMPWFKEGTLLNYLENIDVTDKSDETGFVMPVQRVCRPDHTFRGFQGQIEVGEISVNDEITALPSGEKAKVKAILNTDKEVQKAFKGQAVTIQLDKEVDVSRGCMLVKDVDMNIGKMFTAKLLWMDDSKLVAGKNYYLKIGTKLVPALVMNIKYKIDVNEGNHVQTDKLYKNEIAVCDISCSDKIVFDEFKHHKELGGFILIDRITNMTSACGVVEHPLRRGDNLTWHNMDITRELRAGQKGQTPKTIWLTGLSGAGKSTLVNELEKKLFAEGKHTMVLDGDNVRMGLNKNLGFKEQDRIENIRRIAEVSKLMNDAGIIVLSSFISPFRLDRQNAKDIIGSDSFVEVYVSTPLEECEKRDVKGLYKKARTGEIPNFSGISSPYEAPENPDIEINTAGKTLEESVNYIMAELREFL